MTKQTDLVKVSISVITRKGDPAYKLLRKLYYMASCYGLYTTKNTGVKDITDREYIEFDTYAQEGSGRSGNEL